MANDMPNKDSTKTQQDIRYALFRHMNEEDAAMRDRKARFQERVAEETGDRQAEVDRVYREYNTAGVNMTADSPSLSVEYWNVKANGEEYVVPQPTRNGYRERGYENDGEVLDFGDEEIPMPVAWQGGNPEREKGQTSPQDSESQTSPPEGIEKLHGEIGRYRVNGEDGSTEDLAEILGQIKETYESLSGEKKQDARNRLSDSANNILDDAIEGKREIAVQRARQVQEKAEEIADNGKDMDVAEKTRALDQIEDQYRKLPDGSKESVEKVFEQEGFGDILENALNEDRATLAQAVQVREAQDLVEQVDKFRAKREEMNVAEEAEALDRIEERYEALPESRKKAIRKETTAGQMEVIQKAQGDDRMSLSEALESLNEPENNSTETPPSEKVDMEETQQQIQETLKNYGNHLPGDTSEEAAEEYARMVAFEQALKEQTDSPLSFAKRVYRKENDDGSISFDDEPNGGPQYWKVTVETEEYVVPAPTGEDTYKERGYEGDTETLAFGDDGTPVPAEWNGGRPGREQEEGSRQEEGARNESQSTTQKRGRDSETTSPDQRSPQARESEEGPRGEREKSRSPSEKTSSEKTSSATKEENSQQSSEEENIDDIESAPEGDKRSGGVTGRQNTAAEGQVSPSNSPEAKPKSETSDQNFSGQDPSGQDSSGQDSSGQDSSGQDSSGQDSSGQDSSGQNQKDSGEVGAESEEKKETALSPEGLEPGGNIEEPFAAPPPFSGNGSGAQAREDRGTQPSPEDRERPKPPSRGAQRRDSGGQTSSEKTSRGGASGTNASGRENGKSSGSGGSSGQKSKEQKPGSSLWEGESGEDLRRWAREEGLSRKEAEAALDQHSAKVHIDSLSRRDEFYRATDTYGPVESDVDTESIASVVRKARSSSGAAAQRGQDSLQAEIHDLQQEIADNYLGDRDLPVPPASALNKRVEQVREEIYDYPTQGEIAFSQAASDRLSEISGSDHKYHVPPHADPPSRDREALVRDMDALRRATAADGIRDALKKSQEAERRLEKALERDKARKNGQEDWVPSEYASNDIVWEVEQFKTKLEEDGFEEAISSLRDSEITEAGSTPTGTRSNQDTFESPAQVFLATEEGSTTREAARYALRRGKEAEMSKASLGSTANDPDWEYDRWLVEAQQAYDQRRRSLEEPVQEEAELLGETEPWTPSTASEDKRSEYHATRTLLNEKRRDKDEMEIRFEEEAIKKYENPEHAREIYRQNAEVSEKAARAIVSDPGHVSFGDLDDQLITHPGKLRQDKIVTVSDRETQLKHGLDEVSREIDILEEKLDNLESEIEEDISEMPQPSEMKINQDIAQLENRLERGIKESRAKEIARLTAGRKEAQKLEEEISRLEDVSEVSEKTIAANAKKLKEREQKARREFENSLSLVYKNPEAAVDRFEEISRESGFDEALQTLADDPDELGDIRPDGYVSWQTQVAASRDVGDYSEATKRNAAETYLKAGSGSEAEAAARWQIQDALETELDLQNKADRINARSDQKARNLVYRDGNEQYQKKVDRSAEVIKNLGRERDAREKARGRHPQDRYNGQIADLEDQAGAQTAQLLKRQTKSDDKIRESAAAEKKKKEENLQAALNQVFDNPKEVQSKLEKEAFKEGFSTGTNSFKNVEKKIGTRLGSLGKTKNSSLEAFQKDPAREEGTLSRAVAGTGKALKKARYGAKFAEEVAEGVIEEGPDEETEEALQYYRRGAAIIGAAAAVGGWAGGKAGKAAYGKLRDTMDRQQMRMAVVRRFREYGKATEEYAKHVQGQGSVRSESAEKVPAEIAEIDPKEFEIEFGKHAGKTAQEVADQDPEYITEFFDQEVDNRPEAEEALHKALESRSSQQSPSKPKRGSSQEDISEEGSRPTQEGETLSFGPYKGKTAAEVAEEDPEYAEWCAENLKDKNLRRDFQEATGQKGPEEDLSEENLSEENVSGNGSEDPQSRPETTQRPNQDEVEKRGESTAENPSTESGPDQSPDSQSPDKKSSPEETPGGEKKSASRSDGGQKLDDMITDLNESESPSTEEEVEKVNQKLKEQATEDASNYLEETKSDTARNPAQEEAERLQQGEKTTRRSRDGSSQTAGRGQGEGGPEPGQTPTGGKGGNGSPKNKGPSKGSSPSEGNSSESRPSGSGSSSSSSSDDNERSSDKGRSGRSRGGRR